MVKKSMIENQPCITCQYARVGLALAANERAVNCVIEAYRNHLIAGHGLTPMAAMAQAETLRMMEAR